jgi:hypothetical protein
VTKWVSDSGYSNLGTNLTFQERTINLLKTSNRHIIQVEPIPPLVLGNRNFFSVDDSQNIFVGFGGRRSIMTTLDVSQCIKDASFEFFGRHFYLLSFPIVSKKKF